MNQRLRSILKSYGISGIFSVLRHRLVGSRLKCYPLVEKLVAGKVGIEIGGPSDIFSRRGILPLYPIISSLDNCNFSTSTVWEGSIKEGKSFIFDQQHAPGTQYIMEATNLDLIKTESYDFVLSSHAVEHSANPLQALLELHRVLKAVGVLVLVLPHKERTFDHRRQVTSLEHLIDDYNMGTAEDDSTHIPEILACHDLSLDLPAGNFDTFKARCQRNYENRCLHHHVFDTKLAVEMIDWLKMKIVAVEPTLPFHIFVIAMKSHHAQSTQNAAHLTRDAAYRRVSPFVWDRV